MNIRFIIFYLLILSTIYPSDSTVKAILYKKVIYDYSTPTLINVILNSNSKIENVNIFWNSKSVSRINRLNQPNSSFIESFNFEVNSYRTVNSIEIFTEDSAGNTNMYQREIIFERAFIMSENDFTIKNDSYFIIEVFDNNSDSYDYKVSISNSNILYLPEEILNKEKKRFLFKTVNQGNSIIKISNSAEENSYILKLVNVRVR